MIIIDTTIWSKAYRRRKVSKLSMEDQRTINELLDILDKEEEILIGSVRQELLSGISDRGSFDNLKDKLDGFNNYEAQLADHDLAAEFYTTCLSNGIQGSQTDFLICAVAYRYNSEIFTEDKDFSNYKKYLPIKLYAAITSL
jgi:predicted nucleic acid-binding protein